MILLLLTALLSHADVVGQVNNRPVELSQEYDYVDSEIGVQTARTAMAADRATARTLASTTTFHELIPNPALATDEWRLHDFAHLLAGIESRYETGATLAEHVQRDDWGGGTWGYESWRSHARMDPDNPSQVLYWVKDVRRGRGVWVEERDVLVTFDEVGRVQRAYTSARGEGGEERLTTLAYDEHNHLVTVVQLSLGGVGDSSWARKTVLSAQ